jgi:L-ribulose-5-phosphate 3-epimerase
MQHGTRALAVFLAPALLAGIPGATGICDKDALNSAATPSHVAAGSLCALPEHGRASPLAGGSGTIPARETLLDRIGVFLRCTGQEDPANALEAVRSLGLTRIQVSRLPDRFYTPEGAREFAAKIKTSGIQVEAVVAVFDGESYKDRDAVERTVGFRPAHLQEQRLAYARKCIDFASAVGTKTVTFHVGFLPKDPGDTDYARMLGAVRDLARYAAAKSVTVSLETGQETGEELARFLDQITDARVGVNFDTANLILYGMDSSPRALQRLLNRVTSVHVKDGVPPEDPKLLGREVRLGEGRAEVGECLRILRDSGFRGPLIIENYVSRGLGTSPLEELRTARAFIERSLAQ